MEEEVTVEGTCSLSSSSRCHCDLGTAMLTLDSVSMKDIFCRRAVAIVSVLIILVSDVQSGNQVFVA